MTRSLVYQDQVIGQIYAVADISGLIAERAQVFRQLVLTNGLLTLLIVAIGTLLMRWLLFAKVRYLQRLPLKCLSLANPLRHQRVALSAWFTISDYCANRLRRSSDQSLIPTLKALIPTHHCMLFRHT